MARINSTRTVKAALWALRFYLLVLLTLIGIKFMRVFRSTHQASSASITAPAKSSTNPPAKQVRP